MLKKICVVTAARSEYGLLRWLMEDIKSDPFLELQLVVTGSHLAADFGHTSQEIENDGFAIDAKVDMLLSGTGQRPLVKGMGLCLVSMADALERLAPHMLVVLGDRYELLPVCSAALLMDVPIAHISGGDVTEGAVDDQIRHAITKMSSLHLVSSAQAAQRVRQMGEEDWRICLAGGPGMDNIRRMPRWSRSELAADLGLDEAKDWALLTWHSETKISLKENLATVKDIVAALKEQSAFSRLPPQSLLAPLQIVATYANADYGGSEINEYLEEAARQSNGGMVVRPSLGQLRYVNMLRHARFMIGNSSSAIFETPVLKLPAINIGDRQKGRYLTPNIISCGRAKALIEAAIATVDSSDFKERNKNFASPYGEGLFAEKALSFLKKSLENPERLNLKKFVDLPVPF